MAKKQFNFAQMAESPIAQDANRTMMAAFEQNNGGAGSVAGHSDAAEQSNAAMQSNTAAPEAEPVQPQMSAQPNAVPVAQSPQAVAVAAQQTVGVTAPQTTALSNVLTGADAMRQEYMQFLSVADFAFAKGVNVQLPPDICDKLAAIKEELRRTSNANLKLNIKNLVQLFIYEGVEKWYASVVKLKV